MRSLIPALLFSVALVGHGVAQDPVVTIAPDQEETAEDEGPAGSPLSITIDNSVGYNSETPGFFSESGVDLYLELMRGNVTFTGDLWLGVTGDLTAGTGVLETPTVEFTLAYPKFGEVQWWDADTALGEACVTPAEGSANVGNEDLMTVSTCGSFSGGQSIIYITPDMGGFKFLVSGMSDLRRVLDVGEVGDGVSAALAYEKEINGVTWSASLGVDHALSVVGGVPAGNNLPTTVQAGVAAAWQTWRVGAAGQVDVISFDGTPVWAAGIGVAKTFNDKLTLTAELGTDAHTDAGDPIREVSFGGTAELTLIPDTLTIDSGINLLRRTSPGGLNDTVLQVESGIEVSF